MGRADCRWGPVKLTFFGHCMHCHALLSLRWVSFSCWLPAPDPPSGCRVSFLSFPLLGVTCVVLLHFLLSLLIIHLCGSSFFYECAFWAFFPAVLNGNEHPGEAGLQVAALHQVQHFACAPLVLGHSFRYWDEGV